jgi:hypothetical protein
MKFSFCKIFKHKWIYHFTSFGDRQDFRVCKRCHCLQRYEPRFPVNAWIGTVTYTDKGARENLGEKYGK